MVNLEVKLTKLSYPKLKHLVFASKVLSLGLIEGTLISTCSATQKPIGILPIRMIAVRGPQRWGVGLAASARLVV